MRLLAAALCACLVTASVQAQEPSRPLSDLTTDGVTVFSPTEIRWTLGLEDGAHLPKRPDELAAELQRRYRREGYGKAVVTAAFDDATGRLVITADEGRIDAIAIEGLDQHITEEMRDAFAVRPGDLYNTRVINRAIDALLEPTRGAIRRHYVTRVEPGTVSQGSSDLEGKSTSRSFDLLEREGRRTLVVNLQRVSSDLGAALGTEGREDWYSNVDGLNLAVGFAGAIFDHRKFDHTFLQAYVSYKFARERFGYAVGFERPLFGGAGTPRLLIHADVHDTTASDDFWRISTTEQSLVALTFANSFRDYYNERGYLVGAAFQPNGWNEIRGSWLAVRQEAIENEAEYSVFRDEEDFRRNRRASDGRLRAFVVGYTFDSRGMERESGRASLRRHTAPSMFGEYGGGGPGVRIDWTSELAPAGLGGDFDFTRHIANARVYLPLSPAQRVNARFLFGTSTGTLPLQRVFALGGIGTVHGYSFKEAAGERMVLANIEYHLGSYRDARFIGFFDVGRVYEPVQGSDAWLKGIGAGFAVGDLRLDFGWRTDDIPKSFQMLVRFGPTF